MNRQEYIELLVGIYRLKYRPSELEIQEFRLALEAMPNNLIFTPQKVDNEDEWWRINTPELYRTVMYGCPSPSPISYRNGCVITGSTCTHKKEGDKTTPTEGE